MDSNAANQDAATQPESLPGLLGQLAKSSAAVLHDEIDLFLQQIREKGRAVRGGILLVAAGALFGIGGLGSLCAAAILQLMVYMPPAMAALVTGLGVVFVGIVIAGVGYGKLKKSIRNP